MKNKEYNNNYNNRTVKIFIWDVKSYELINPFPNDKF